MSQTNYYDVLQVSQNADQDLITAAWRHLSKKYHPDVSTSAADARRMALINEAYDVLRDPDRRRNHDFDLASRQSAQPQQPQPAAKDHSIQIAFQCPRCEANQELRVHSPPEFVTCYRCDQTIRLRPAGTVPPPQPPPRQPPPEPPVVRVLTGPRLQQLAEMNSNSQRPGDIYCYVGIPVLAAVLLLSLMGLTVASGMQQLICAVSIVVSIGGSIGLVIIQADFNRKHLRRLRPIRFDYSLTPLQANRFTALRDSLSALSRTRLWRADSRPDCIAPVEGVHVFKGFPKWGECNCDTYCLSIGNRKHYFLPDAVLVEINKQFYVLGYEAIVFSMRGVRVYSGQRVVGHRWAHARVDGGPDRRFRNNYQVPIHQDIHTPSVALHWKQKDGEVLFVAEQPGVLENFQVAINGWHHMRMV
jgi:hypothetical protein